VQSTSSPGFRARRWKRRRSTWHLSSGDWQKDPLLPLPLPQTASKGCSDRPLEIPTNRPLPLQPLLTNRCRDRSYGNNTIVNDVFIFLDTMYNSTWQNNNNTYSERIRQGTNRRHIAHQVTHQPTHSAAPIALARRLVTSLSRGQLTDQWCLI
jgi:hypothetical protein